MFTHPELGTYIDRTYKVVRQDLINRFKAARIDLTPEQWIILLKLHKEKAMFQTDLAGQSFKDKPTVSRIIDLLSKKGWVQRTQDVKDGRRFQVSLTKQGEEIVDYASPIVEQSREIGWNDLTEKEYETLVSILDKIFNNYISEK